MFIMLAKKFPYFLIAVPQKFMDTTNSLNPRYSCKDFEGVETLRSRDSCLKRYIYVPKNNKIKWLDRARERGVVGMQLSLFAFFHLFSLSSWQESKRSIWSGTTFWCRQPSWWNQTMGQLRSGVPKVSPNRWAGAIIQFSQTLAAEKRRHSGGTP